MRKIMALIFAACMLLSTASCQSGSISQESESDTTTALVPPETSISAETVAETDPETETATGNETETEPETESLNEGCTPENCSMLMLANDDVYAWYSTYFDRRNRSDYYFKKHQDLYDPNPVTFSWKANEHAESYTLYISTDEQFPEDKTQIYPVDTNSLTLSHLFTGTTYYWYVLCTESSASGEETTIYAVHPMQFSTAESPRWVKIDGVSNTRDIGGYAAAEGYRVKQGMVYRGGQLENITDQGKDYFLNVLGIKTDFDIRGGGISSSFLGDNVNYVNLSGHYYVSDGVEGINSDEGKAVVAQAMRVFAEPCNYPIYLHCAIGRDRTGTLAFLLEALLGVMEDDLYVEYEMFVLSEAGTPPESSLTHLKKCIREVYAYIDSSYPGETFAQKTENYLLDAGVTAEEIQTIRNLLLEENQ